MARRPLARVEELSERDEAEEGSISCSSDGSVTYAASLFFGIPAGSGNDPGRRQLLQLPGRNRSQARLILPTHTLLNPGALFPGEGVRRLMQPVMGPVFKTRAFQRCTAFGREKSAEAQTPPRKDFYQVLRNTWALGEGPRTSFLRGLLARRPWKVGVGKNQTRRTHSAALKPFLSLSRP